MGWYRDVQMVRTHGQGVGPPIVPLTLHHIYQAHTVPETLHPMLQPMCCPTLCPICYTAHITPHTLPQKLPLTLQCMHYTLYCTQSNRKHRTCEGPSVWQQHRADGSRGGTWPAPRGARESTLHVPSLYSWALCHHLRSSPFLPPPIGG